MPPITSTVITPMGLGAEIHHLYIQRLSCKLPKSQAFGSASGFVLSFLQSLMQAFLLYVPTRRDPPRSCSVLHYYTTSTSGHLEFKTRTLLQCPLDVYSIAELRVFSTKILIGGLTPPFKT